MGLRRCKREKANFSSDLCLAPCERKRGSLGSSPPLMWRWSKALSDQSSLSKKKVCKDKGKEVLSQWGATPCKMCTALMGKRITERRGVLNPFYAHQFSPASELKCPPFAHSQFRCPDIGGGGWWRHSQRDSLNTEQHLFLPPERVSPGPPLILWEKHNIRTFVPSSDKAKESSQTSLFQRKAKLSMGLVSPIIFRTNSA